MKCRWARANKQTEPTPGPRFVKLYQEGVFQDFLDGQPQILHVLTVSF